MEKQKATPEQIQLAKQYRIPLSQAHTINLEKVKKYREYLKSDKGKVETALDRLGFDRG